MNTKNPLGKLQARSVKALGDAGPEATPTPRPSPGMHPAGFPDADKDHGKRRRGSGEIVSQTVRLRREDWQRMAELRIHEGISSQQQFIMALGLLFAQKGLEPPVAP